MVEEAPLARRLRAPAAFEPEAPLEGLRLTAIRPDRMTAARARVLELAQDGMAWTRAGLAHAAGVSPGVVDGLMAQGSFETVRLPPPPVVPAPDPAYGGAVLTGEQAAAEGDGILARRHGGLRFSRRRKRAARSG